MTSSTNLNIPEDARCLSCGYSLRQLRGTVCPECGRPFEQDIRDLYSGAAQRARRRQYELQPPDPVMNGVAIAITAVAILDFSTPGTWLLTFFLVPFVVMALLLITYRYARKYAARARRRKNREVHVQLLQDRGRRWKVVPVCLLILASLLVPPSWPLRLRFMASRTALERQAKQLTAGVAQIKNQWVGLFFIQSANVPLPGAVFLQTGHAFLNEKGLLFLPNISPSALNGSDFYCRGRLNKDWHVAEEDF